MEYKDYYKILGVAKSANQKEIKSAYRRLARRFHPDKNPNDESAGEKLKTINEAYEVLGDPENRSRYDRLGHNYHRFQQAGGNPADFDFSQFFQGGGGRRRTDANMNDVFGGGGSASFSQFFESIFGGGGFGSQPGMGQRRAGGAQRRQNLDVEQPVEVTLEEAYHGTSREFRLNGDRFTAKIPPGSKSGTRIRLRGKGNVGQTRTGDLFLVIQVKEHDTFEVDGSNLWVKVEVDLLTAVLGGTAVVPTLTGPVNLTIPAGTQGAQTVRLKGKGMPKLDKNEGTGDLMAKLQIRIPNELTEDEKQLYLQLAKLSRGNGDG
jgi:curved DNA-binding protein